VLAKYSPSNQNYALLWERRVERLIKEGHFENALRSAKDYMKSCAKHGFYTKSIEAEILIAKVYLRVGDFKESLFKTLYVMDKTERGQMEIQTLETSLLLIEIHLAMDNPYEALTLLNKICADVLAKSTNESIV
jgi:hypothetical protein